MDWAKQTIGFSRLVSVPIKWSLLIGMNILFVFLLKTNGKASHSSLNMRHSKSIQFSIIDAQWRTRYLPISSLVRTFFSWSWLILKGALIDRKGTARSRKKFSQTEGNDEESRLAIILRNSLGGTKKEMFDFVFTLSLQNILQRTRLE